MQTKEERKVSNLKYRLDRAAKGICQRCKSPAAPGRAACEPCSIKKAAYTKQYKADLKAKASPITAITPATPQPEPAPELAAGRSWSQIVTDWLRSLIK